MPAHHFPCRVKATERLERRGGRASTSGADNDRGRRATGGGYEPHKAGKNAIQSPTGGPRLMGQVIGSLFTAPGLPPVFRLRSAVGDVPGTASGQVYRYNEEELGWVCDGRPDLIIYKWGLQDLLAEGSAVEQETNGEAPSASLQAGVEPNNSTPHCGGRITSGCVRPNV
ncbi:uncharacterized protein METZ01_LOCUS340521 [marine metagenome]|uniref:Uncharacterized protein n=1 Tax=marine metagenome TaxID=408172 RepID=A0A382QRS8_9ZZZZ